MPAIVQRLRARRALIETFDYLEGQAGVDVAARFLTAVADTLEVLAGTPHMGAPCGFQRPALRSVRRWPVKGFENWLILYRPMPDGIDVIHVVHGARDIGTAVGDRP